MVDLIESMQDQLLTLEGTEGESFVCRLVGLFPYEGKQYALLLNLGNPEKPDGHRLIDVGFGFVPVYVNRDDATNASRDEEEIDSLEESGMLFRAENFTPVTLLEEATENEETVLKVSVDDGEFNGRQGWISRLHLSSSDDPTTVVMEFYVRGAVQSDTVGSAPLFPLPPPGETIESDDRQTIENLYQQGAALRLDNGTAVHVLGNPSEEILQVVVQEGTHKDRGGWIARRNLRGDQAIFRIIESDDEFDRVLDYVRDLASSLEEAEEA